VATYAYQDPLVDEERGVLMQPASDSAPTQTGTVRRGILTGVMPLARMIILSALVLVLSIAARLVTQSQSFGVQQGSVIITFAVALVIAAIVYTASLIGAFRRIRAWSQVGLDTTANAALWTVAVTALVVVAPIVVAAILPQHPAP
jgi:hypothetical protein